MSSIPPQQAIRIIIADDHPVVVSGLTLVLQNHPRIEVVATVGSFNELAEKAPALAPNLVLLDIAGMSTTTGSVTFVELFRRTHPHINIIIFSSDVSLSPELLKAGALGYVSKGEPQYLVLDAIVIVASGHMYVSPSVQKYLDRCKPNVRGSSTLTPQQLMIAKLLSQGLSTTAVASQLGIERETVLNHVTEAKRRIGCITRVELLQWYQRCYGVT